MNKIGIVVAMEDEVEGIIDLMTDLENETLYNLNFYKGKIQGKNCVVVESGIGKVNAGRATQALIDKFKVTSIINVGAAASVNELLNIGDVVLGKFTIQHDFDITAFDHSKGYITGVGYGVESDERLIEESKNVIDKIQNKDFDVKVGNVATGDIFCTEVSMKDKISTKFDADVVDMECGAVAQVAYLCDIPFMAIRSVSDTPNGNNAEDFDNNLAKASSICAEVLKEVIKNVNFA